MAMAAVRVHEYTARDSLPEKPTPLAAQCQDWVDDTGSDLLENTTRTAGCNPKNRQQPSDNIPIYYDGSLVYFCVVFPVLFVFVFVLGDEPHNIKYSTWREGLGRTVSWRCLLRGRIFDHPHGQPRTRFGIRIQWWSKSTLVPSTRVFVSSGLGRIDFPTSDLWGTIDG